MKGKTHGNGNENSGDMGGWWKRPGEYIERQVTSDTESDLVEKQAWIFTKSIFVIQLAIALVVLVAYLAFGVIVLAACGWIMLWVGCWLWCRWREHEALQRSDERVEVGIPILLTMAATVVFGFTWTQFFDALTERTGLMLLALVLTTYFSIPFVIPRLFLTWRMAAEVSDIGISRNALTEYYKPVWPWTPNDRLAPSIVEDEPAPDYVGTAVRPLTINGNGKRESDKPKTWTSERTGLTWPVLDKPHVIERDNGHRYVLAPTDEYLAVQDLMYFVQVGIRGGVGASYRKWQRDKKTRPNGMGEEHWRSVVHYLAEIGVVDAPVERGRTEFVVDTVKDATSLILKDITAEDGEPEMVVNAPSGNGKHPPESRGVQSNAPTPLPDGDVSGVESGEGVDRQTADRQI